jgi:uncharacterized protein (TIGR02001 family)
MTIRRLLAHGALGVCVTCAIINHATADQDGPALAAKIGFGSDYAFRGVSQTLGNAAAEAYGEVAFDSGLYAYAWGSNVDFVPDGEPDDGATYEIDAVIGYFHSFNDRLAADVALVRYLFPNTEIDANYAELITTLWLDDRHYATVGYSNDVFGSEADGLFYSMGTSQEMPLALTLSVELGYYDLGNAYDAAYSYASLGLERAVGPVTVSLTYYDTFGDDREIFYSQSVGSRVVLAVGLDLLQ